MSLPPSEVPQGAIRFNTDSQRLEFYAQGEWWVMSTDTPNLGRDVDSTPGARGLAMGGNNGSNYNDIDYINISSTGNAQDFGDLIQARNYLSGTSNSVRGFFTQGSTPTYVNTCEFVTIASTGNAQDFGDFVNATYTYDNAGSDSHGGLS